jgi:CCR4-NOT transcriptional regulation complex NOT5 subunit
LFDEIWEKVYSAEQQNQKEKYEMDLKKEIKKLQRLRDQIKSWISSAEVKDKDALFEARKLIETKMEAFKTCEKETKTKTYSKEGLARAEQLSPEEEAKRNTSAWITDTIERLQTMVQDQEVEIEKLQNGKGKKTNKNIIDECNHFIAMHRYHLNKLEAIMRLVNNDMLETDDVDPLREDLDYYMDSYKEDEYQQAYDEDFFYESLGLDDLPVITPPILLGVTGGGGSIAGSSSQQTDKQGKNGKNNKDNEDVASSSSKGSKDKKGNKKGAGSTVIPLTIGRARVSSKGASIAVTGPGATMGKPGGYPGGHSMDGSDDDNSTGRTTPIKLSVGGKNMSTSATPTMPTPTTIPAARTASGGGPGHPGGGPASMPSGGASMAAILKRETEQQEKERQMKVSVYVCVLCYACVMLVLCGLILE